MNPIRRKIPILLISVALIGLTFACQSQAKRDRDTPNEPTPTDPSTPVPDKSITPPEITTEPSLTCQENINAVRKNLEAAIRRNEYVDINRALAIEKARQVWVDSRCKNARAQFRQVLEVAWRRQVSNTFEYGRLMASNNQGVCSSGCGLNVDDIGSCNRSCDTTYQSTLQRLQEEYKTENAEIDRFFQMN